MNCKVCLAEEEEPKDKYSLRLFDISLEKVESELRDIDLQAEECLSGIRLSFKDEASREEAYRRLKKYVYSKGSSMEVEVGNLLRERGITLSTAESCTGGLLSARLVNVPGSSSYFVGGVVLYSNQLKETLLGVNRETLSKFGAVSEEVCKEMLDGLKSRFSTDSGIAITGVAGPGGSEKKPEGLTYIGVFFKRKFYVDRRIFNKGRNPNRFLSSQVALNNLRKIILEEEP